MKKRLIRIVSVCLSLIVFITSLNLSFLVKADSNIIEEFLLKLQNAGYDYLFVCSAGNSNDKRYGYYDLIVAIVN